MSAVAGGKVAGGKATQRPRKRRNQEPGQGSQNEGDNQEECKGAREKLEGISDRMDITACTLSTLECVDRRLGRYQIKTIGNLFPRSTATMRFHEMHK